MKKAVVISTSLRAGSNSDALADKFIEGARNAGNEVEKISLSGKDISFCRGCLAGTLFCGGVEAPKDIAGSPKLQEAYELGRQSAQSTLARRRLKRQPRC